MMMMMMMTMMMITRAPAKMIADSPSIGHSKVATHMSTISQVVNILIGRTVCSTCQRQTEYH